MQLPFPLDENGSAVSTREVLCDSRKNLLEYGNRRSIPADMEGGVLFEGVVLDVQTQLNGIEAVSMVVEFIVLNDGAISPLVTVLSPAVGKGGVGFDRGKKYRVFAVPMRGKYYTWASATADLYDQGRDKLCS